MGEQKLGSWKVVRGSRLGMLVERNDHSGSFRHERIGRFHPQHSHGSGKLTQERPWGETSSAGNCISLVGVKEAWAKKVGPALRTHESTGWWKPQVQVLAGTGGGQS